ncbi:hypothetical protein P5V15_014012 [Pogonomyrmex californicus]
MSAIIAVEKREEEIKENYVGRIVFEKIESKDWRAAQLEDPPIINILHGKELNRHPLREEIVSRDVSAKIYWFQWDFLVLRDGILCRRWESPDLKTFIFQTIVPEKMV